VFSGFPNRNQNGLIEATGDVVRYDIKKEISAAPFVAVVVDEQRMLQSSDLCNFALCG